jgi:sigma-B regulation protein RsbU (phosphoserine phosphatase)
MLFSQITRDALQLIALEVGDAIDRSRLEVAAEKARWEAARAIGAEIKRELVPDTEKSGPFFHVVGKVTPSRSVGGDVILVTELQSSGVAIAVGDVAGKGPAAALMASFLLGVMDAMVATHTVPREVVRAINAAMLSRQMESRFATMFYATLHADGALQYCNAGHNPPLIVSDGGIQRLETGGMVLGLFEHAPYEDAVIQLAPGDTVIAFSDGVTEARNNVGEEFSDERLVRLVQEHARESIPALRDTVLAELDMFRGSAPLSDDASLLVLRYRPIATS